MPQQHSDVQPLVVAGRLFNSKHERGVLVHEYFSWKWGFRNDADVERILGQSLIIESMPTEVSSASVFNWFSATDFSISQQIALGALIEQLPELVETLDVPDAAKSLLKQAFTPKRKEHQEQPVEQPIPRVELPIIGVFRSPTRDEFSTPPFSWRFSSAVCLVAEETDKHLMHKASAGESDYQSVILEADRKENVRSVVDAVTAAGFQTS